MQLALSHPWTFPVCSFSGLRGSLVCYVSSRHSIRPSWYHPVTNHPHDTQWSTFTQPRPCLNSRQHKIAWDTEQEMTWRGNFYSLFWLVHFQRGENSDQLEPVFNKTSWEQDLKPTVCDPSWPIVDSRCSKQAALTKGELGGDCLFTSADTKE